MKENILAKRYAKALFELANEKGILEIVHQEVTFFNDHLKADRNFQFFLNSQQISKREKNKAIERLFQDRVSNLFFNFLLVLLKKNRQSIFPLIAREFTKLFDKSKKRIHAITTTAIPLDEASLSRLKQVLSKKFDADVEIKNDIKPDILGGLIIRVDGQVLDGSLQSQLNRLKHQLTENSKLRGM